MTCGSRTNPRMPGRKKRRSPLAIGIELADELFRKIVVTGRRCIGHPDLRGVKCNESTQVAHLVSRVYKNVRWDEDNAVELCCGAHRAYTSLPIEWERFCINHLGQERYDALKRRALVPWDGDIQKVIERLKARMG
jgi:hypothetical protein